ncbi:MAG TPA: hypothetical protein VN222_02315 [Novosphingobium sp.]|nr:hypothetical protein [Novosphingobium sp.]
MAFAAAALATVPGVVRAAEPPCLTTGEFGALAAYGLPGMIEGVSRRCAAHLPAGAFLNTAGGALIARYSAAKPAAWPAAKAVLMKVSGNTPAAALLLSALPDHAQQQLVDTLLAGVVEEKFPAETCPMADRLFALLAPLPPENTAEVVGISIGLGARANQGRIGPVRLCMP